MRRRGRELRWFGFHLIVASLAFGLALALGAGALMLVRWALPLELASSSAQKALEASGRILELHEKFWPVTLVSLAGVALAAAWLGRRITGPLVRFTDSFRRIAAGELPEALHIRANDYLVDEVTSLNDMLAALKLRAAEQARGRREVMAALEELIEHSAKSEDDTLASLATRALERMRALDGRAS